VLKCCQKKTKLKIPTNVVRKNVCKDDAEDVFGVYAYISKLYLTNLEK
jgi:hypothetical protein